MNAINTVFQESSKEDRSSSMSYGERISLILEQQKRSKAWLANQIGITRQALNYLINHGADPKLVNEIASALEVNPGWLKDGHGNILINSLEQEGTQNIPLITFSDIPSLKEKKVTISEFIISHMEISKLCFATTLDNSAMEPLFLQGSVLIFDPEKKPKNGDYIIFSRANDKKEVLFRRFFKEGNDIYLVPSNSLYKKIEKEPVIIYGTLVESRYFFK